MALHTLDPIESFCNQLKDRPHSPAIVFGERVIDFQECNRLANRTARYLRAHGIGPEESVGVCLERGPEAICVFIAALKCGAAFVPMDPSFPVERLNDIVSDAKPKLIISGDRSLWSRVGHNPQICSYDETLDSRRHESADDADNVTVGVARENIAYVIYTSGSTGKPKGVAVTYGALSNALDSFRRLFEITASDRWLSVSSLCFDIAVLEWLLPISTGAMLVMAAREDTTDGQRLAAIAASNNVTVLQATPSTWRMLLTKQDVPSSIRVALVGGELLSAQLASQLSSGNKRAVWNLYGPTETTIWSTACRLTETAYIENPSIGQAVDNTAIYVLDDSLQPVSPPESGELYIGGIGVARGYWANPKLSAERFVADPFSPNVGQRMYRTGDVVRRRSDGALDFIGRIDLQVKVRGHRIELVEIENAMRRFTEIADVAAGVRTDASGEQELVAYVVPMKETVVEDTELRSRLQALLPSYMIPSHFVYLDRLPLTTNGKVDRKSLPSLSSIKTGVPAAGFEKATSTEKQVAAIWSDVLQVDRIRLQDNFFDLGGHSLLMTQVLLRVGEIFGLDFPIVVLLDNPTVSSLSKVIDTHLVETPLSEEMPGF